MNDSLKSLLTIAVVAGSVVVLVLLGFFREAGRQRLLPVLRPLLKRVINPRILRAVSRGESNYAVVHHVGRRSGKAYQTPVDAYRTAEGTLILLPYGPVTDWCKNVLAAGHCTLSVNGQDLPLNAPEVVAAGAAEARLPVDVARRWHRQGIAHYLWLKGAAPSIEAAVEPGVAVAFAGQE